jgi:hypothetical protein
MLHDVLAICSVRSWTSFSALSVVEVRFSPPLLVYVVGIRSSHVAIGTSSAAVALCRALPVMTERETCVRRTPTRPESAGFTGLQRMYWDALRDAVSVFVTGHKDTMPGGDQP